MNDNYYENKTMVITGAGSGIGRLMAIGAAKKGADIAIWDYNEKAAKAVCEEIKSQTNRTVIAYKLDVSDFDAVLSVAEKTISEIGEIDILINNAGVVSGKSLQELTKDDIMRTFNVNTLSLFWTTKALLPSIAKSKEATIVTVASAAGMVAVAKQTDYAASKFAAVGFMDSLRAELQKENKNINCLTVCPYYIDTGMFKGVKTNKIMPILKPKYVAMKILLAITQKKTKLIMPPLVKVAPIAQTFPAKFSDKILNILKLNSGMDEFIGH